MPALPGTTCFPGRPGKIATRPAAPGCTATGGQCCGTRTLGGAWGLADRDGPASLAHPRSCSDDSWRTGGVSSLPLRCARWYPGEGNGEGADRGPLMRIVLSAFVVALLLGPGGVRAQP